MKAHRIWLVLLMALIPSVALSQGQRPTITVFNLGAPSGGCPGPNYLYVNTANGAQYSCPTRTLGWTAIGPGSGNVPLGTAGQFPVMNAGATAYAPVSLSQDGTVTSAGALTVAGLKGNILPSLSTGYLNWTGSAWALSAVSGTGNVSTSGTITTGQIALWASSTAIKSVAMSGDGTLNSSGVLVVTGLNGTPLSGLATGLVKNTTATGVPSIAVAADVYGLWSGSCSASTFLRGDGSCQTPAGSGNVTAAGTLTNNAVSIGQGAQGIATISVDSTTTHALFATAGAPAFRAIVAGDIPTLNQSTTGSAATWTTARNLAGNSVNGSANVPFANAFVVQGTTDAGLSAAQFLGALGTGPLKNTTTTGVLSLAASADIFGLWSGSCSSTTFLRGDGACATPSGSGTINAGAQFSNSYYSAAGSASTLSAATLGTNQGTYYLGRVNTVQGTATAPVDLQAGDCSGGGTSISGATTSYTVLFSDVPCTITHDRAASGTVNPVTIPTPTTLNNSNPVFVYENDSSQTDVLTPTTFTVALGHAAAAATLNIPSNVSCRLSLDSHNASTWEANCHPIATTAAGSGTVTVVGAGSLTSTALETGGGSQTTQTPCATCTLDGSGNLAVAAGGSLGSADTGAPKLTFATNKATINQPFVHGVTTNQIVTGTTTNLTTSNYPASSGAVTLTFPNVTTNVAGVNSDTTTTHVAHATATNGVISLSALAAGDLPSTLTSGTAITNAALTSPTLGTPATGTLTNTTGYLEQNLTGASAAGTITEGSATASVTRAGIATANLTAPQVVQNTNSSNNNTSITMGISSPGTSTGQTTLNVNGAATGGDLTDWGTGGTWTAGVLSGQTINASVLSNGAFQSKGTTAGFMFLTQGSTSSGVTPCNAANTHCIQAGTATTASVETDAPAQAQGIPTRTGVAATIQDGYSGDANHSATVTTGSGTSIGSTSLCSTAICLVGTYRVNVYIDITTACGTSGTYVVNLIYTDDQGSKTVPVNLTGTGSVPATGVLTTTSTANFGYDSFILRSTGAASINYSTTAVACGTAGPMVGKLYLSVEPLM